MKCGKCGNSHDSADDVRACYGLPHRGSGGSATVTSHSKANGTETPARPDSAAPSSRGKRVKKAKKLPKAASATVGPTTGNHHAPGTVTPYGTGLVHAPGSVEFDSREECEWCGHKVASGEMHDC